MMKQHKYRLMIACAGALWGMISIFFKILSAQGLDKIQVVVLRFGFAAVLLCLWLAVRSPQALRLRHPWHLLYFVGTGIASQAFFNLCYYAAIERAGVAVAALLLYTAPAFVILFSRMLFAESMTKGKMVALILTIAGCTCITGVCSGGISISPLAFIYGLGSGIGYALYSIFGKFALRDYPPETVTVYSFVFAALGMLPLAHPAALFTALAKPAVLLGSTALALICTVLPYLLYTAGLTHTDAGQASILATVEPVVAALIGFFMFHEAAALDKLAGILLILAAIILAGLPPRTNHPQTEAAGHKCQKPGN